MKIVLLLIGLGMMYTCQQKQPNVEAPISKIKYSAITRGSSFTCVVAQNEVSIASEGSATYQKSKEITKEQWRSLLESCKGIVLNKMDELIAPSHESETDRTRIATLIIIADDQTYESNPFDEGNPPKVLVPLINNMLALAKTVD